MGTTRDDDGWWVKFPDYRGRTHYLVRGMAMCGLMAVSWGTVETRTEHRENDCRRCWAKLDADQGQR